MIVTIIIGFFLLMSCMAFAFQQKMIYFPRRYDPSYARGLPRGTVELNYRTSQGAQTAFYIPPMDGSDKPPGRLWAVFSGNASVALDWLDTVEAARGARAGYLLMDYPGYGKCEGAARRGTIRESSEAAFRALADHLHCPLTALETGLNILGFSIGSATGLDFAAGHPVKQVVLLAPFTSLLDMARLSVGWPLCNLLRDRYDNRARLAGLASRADPPAVLILHGTADDIVPFRMSKELSGRHPTMITLRPVAGADHNTLMTAAEKQIADLLRPDGVLADR